MPKTPPNHSPNLNLEEAVDEARRAREERQAADRVAREARERDKRKKKAAGMVTAAAQDIAELIVDVHWWRTGVPENFGPCFLRFAGRLIEFRDALGQDDRSDALRRLKRLDPEQFVAASGERRDQAGDTGTPSAEETLTYAAAMLRAALEGATAEALHEKFGALATETAFMAVWQVWYLHLPNYLLGEDLPRQNPSGGIPSPDAPPAAPTAADQPGPVEAPQSVHHAGPREELEGWCRHVLYGYGKTLAHRGGTAQCQSELATAQRLIEELVKWETVPRPVPRVPNVAGQPLPDAWRAEWDTALVLEEWLRREASGPDDPPPGPEDGQSPPPAPARHSRDFRFVHWYGEGYEFTGAQAKAVGLLWEAWQNGTPSLAQETLLEGLDSKRLVDVFRKDGRPHEAWGRMIVPAATKGAYRLQEPSQ